MDGSGSRARPARNSIATVRANPDDVAITHTLTADPLTQLVSDSFGSWISKPFQAVVLTSFLACAISIQTTGTRVLYSLSRDGALPMAKSLKKVSARHIPRNAVVTTAALGAVILCVGLNGSAVSTLIAFISGGYYASFLLAALYARVRGRWNPAKGEFRLGRWGLTVNILAAAGCSSRPLTSPGADPSSSQRAPPGSCSGLCR